MNDVEKYEWSEWYKSPNNKVKFNQAYLDGFWRFIYDRMEIYYKRVVLKLSYPWTDDEIFKVYRFTNISRDLDKLTLYEISHILSKLDEEVDDIRLRKISVMFNIMLFRVFVKIDTYECFGFIDFSDSNWKEKWNHGKSLVLKRQSRGINSFTGSFMVNNLKSCNPDSKSNSNKTLNALLLCDKVLDNIDEIYHKAVEVPTNMKEQLEYLKTLSGIGNFTSYELACSFAMSNRYCKNPLVSWTQDNYTSIGPGSSRGIDYVYACRGNLSKIECVIYLRSIWASEMQRLGIYDQFIRMLPPVLGRDLDLRTIEHCLCEYHKYVKLQEGTGHTKRTFVPETIDVDQLVYIQPK